MKNRSMGKACLSIVALLAMGLGIELSLEAQTYARVSQVRQRATSTRTVEAIGSLTLEKAVIVGANSVSLGRDSVVSGDVVVNEISSGVVLAPPKDLNVQRDAHVTGNLAANSIQLARFTTSVNGLIYTNNLQNDGATCTPGPCAAAAGYLPSVFTLPPVVSVAPPRFGDVVVGFNETKVLGPGDYGNVSVAQGGVLVLSGGVYNVANVAEGANSGGQCPLPCRSIVFAAPGELRVAGVFNIGKSARIGPAVGSGISASSIVINVNGLNGGDGSPNATPAAARTGQGSDVDANFYVPNGTLHLEQNCICTGAFLARDVKADNSSQVNLDSAFGNKPPVASPQTVRFEGASTVITLTCIDPEGEDVSFAVGTAGKGTLTGLALIPPAPVLVPDREHPGIDCSEPANQQFCIFEQAPVTMATAVYTYDDPVPTDPLEREDMFSFTCSDGSGVGMANVLIKAVEPPETHEDLTDVSAKDASVVTPQGTLVTVPLVAAAPAVGEPPAVPEIVFSIVTPPSHGSLGAINQPIPSGSATVAYTPDTSPTVFSGTDSFTFKAEADLNGNLNTTDPGESAVGLVTITVAELAPNQNVNTSTGLTKQIVLSGTGLGGSPLLPAVTRAVGAISASVAGRVASTTGGASGDASDGFTPPRLVAAGVNVPPVTTQSYDFEQPTFPAAGAVIGTVDGIDFDAQTSTYSGTVPSGTQVMTGSTGTGGTAIVDFTGLANKPYKFSLIGLDLTTAGDEIIEITVDFTTGPNQVLDVGLGGQPSLTPIPFSFEDQSDTIEKLTMRGTESANRSAVRAWLIDDLSIESGSPISGTVRFQAEWDITGLLGILPDLVGAQVTLNTVKGANSSLDTSFYAGAANQNGSLSPSDFEAPVAAIDGAVMPAGTAPVGTAGTFTFDVTNQVIAALSGDNPFATFSVQGRVVEEGVSFEEGLQIRSSHADNVATFKDPILTFSTPPPVFIPPLVVTITSLPVIGTLSDPVLGAITSAPFELSGSTVNYIAPSIAGTPSFEYSVFDPITGVTDSGLVNLFIVQGSCLENVSFCIDGRP